MAWEGASCSVLYKDDRLSGPGRHDDFATHSRDQGLRWVGAQQGEGKGEEGEGDEECKAGSKKASVVII